MQNSSRLALYHYWVAFGVFLPAVVLGAWQMLMRSPLPAPLDDPNAYYTSVTLHGTAMTLNICSLFTIRYRNGECESAGGDDAPEGAERREEITTRRR